MKSALFIILTLITLIGLAACAPTSSPTPGGSPSPTASPTGGASPTAGVTGQPVTIDLTARNIDFDKQTITVPAGARVTIRFDNRDNGIPHNFALYTDQSASTKIFAGEIFPGPATRDYTFQAPDKAGNYFFRCDTHPTQMTGTCKVQ